ncbi:DinB family protein [Dyadobacter sandarakinus]|uniref:DinB family protein n=1 Tax=Dyadobacter sandarakinus TaxID=2747268 RepID=A0ABX7I170_9BACT|nr:DinB family protein [Dyadobacter sandarakinus]QRQ99518.1 DinB family protein [Dyadobacter sandarakinus]
MSNNNPQLITTIQTSLFQQFEAGLITLGNAIERCPQQLWNTKKRFFYIAYHALILAEYYLTIPAPETFHAILPFSFTEPDEIPDGVVGDMVPDKHYTQPEMLGYVEEVRAKCRETIFGLSEENISERWIEPGGEMDYAALEILIYNLRHVQHHAAQLNLLLRQEAGMGSEWVFRGGE